MTTSTVAPRAPAVQATQTVSDLQRAAVEERDTFEIHWSVCRNRLTGRFCQRCDDLDVTAFAAERVYLEASRVG